MKLRNLVSSVAILTFSAHFAQQNPLFFSTGLNSALTGQLPVNTGDLKWKVSRTGVNGTYVTPVRTNYAWPVSNSNQGAWITYPDTCDPAEPAEHGCTTQYDSAIYFYKLTFDLPDSICGKAITSPDAYCLAVRFWADNSVYRVNQNGNQVYLTTSSTPYDDADHSSTTNITVQMCSNWQQFGNTIIVEVRSEAVSGPGGWTGFLARGDANYSTDPSNPCDSVPDYDDDGGGGVDPPVGDCCLGNQCGQHSNPLATNYEIPLAGNDFYFSGDAPSPKTGGLDQVGVGYDCRNMMPAKFSTRTDENTSTPDGNGYPESIAIHGISTYNGMNETSVGVYGEAKNMEPQSKSIGVWGDALGAGHNIGGRFYAEGGQDFNIGVSAIARPTTGTPAPHLYPGGSNIGIYAAGDLTGMVPNPGTLDWAGWFDGDVMINGTGVNSSFIPFTSDRKFKREIQPINNASAIIAKLNPSTYLMDTQNKFGLKFSDKKQFGFISQEVETVLPELVHEVKKPAMFDAEGNTVTPAVEFKALDYIGFIALLAQGMKEQQETIGQQQAQINELKAMMKQSVGGKQDMGTQKSELIQLSDKKALVLNQNVPNPFAESTVITYNIPEGFSKAQLIFRTSDGMVIKTAEITRAGKGSFTVFADDLSNGSYSYSLVVDGKVADSKNMIKQ